MYITHPHMHTYIHVGLARTIYIRCTYGIFGLEITKYTVYIYVYIRFWPTLHTRIHAYTHTYIHAYTHTPTHAHIHTRIFSQGGSCPHTCTYTCTHIRRVAVPAHMHTHIHARIFAGWQCPHTCTHTCTHFSRRVAVPAHGPTMAAASSHKAAGHLLRFVGASPSCLGQVSKVRSCLGQISKSIVRWSANKPIKPIMPWSGKQAHRALVR